MALDPHGRCEPLLSKARGPIDAVFAYLAVVFERLGLSPNAVSVLGLVVSGAGAYLIATGSLIVGAATAGFGAVLDLVDGIMARRMDATSLVGGYMDSLFDRYVDAFAFVAIAWHYDEAWIWAASLLGFLGAAATSYAKARLYEDVPPQGADWADLVEHGDRLVALLFGAGFQGIADALDAGVQFLPWIVLVVAVLGHVTVVQRALRAKRLMEEAGGGR